MFHVCCGYSRRIRYHSSDLFVSSFGVGYGAMASFLMITLTNRDEANITVCEHASFRETKDILVAIRTSTQCNKQLLALTVKIEE